MTQRSSEAQNTDQPNREAIFEQLGLNRYRQRRELIDIGELPLHVELYSCGDPGAPTVLFLPGIGTYSELYCEFLAGLADEGFNVVGVDPRGHGYSGGPRGLFTLPQVVSDLGLVLDHLQTRLSGPIGLFGCSLGARLGLALAEQDTRIRSLLCHTLFLAEIPPDVWHYLGWHGLQYADLLTPAFMAPYATLNFRRFIDIEELLKDNPLGRFADQDSLLVWDYPISTLNSIYSYPSNLLAAELGIPAAIMVGSEDNIITPDYIETLVAHSRQPFEQIRIAGGGHMLPFEHINDTLKASSAWFHRTLQRHT